MYLRSDIEMNEPSTSAEEKIGDQQFLHVSHESVNVLRASPSSIRARARQSSSTSSSHEGTHEIFRPRSFFEHEIFSERRILLSSPIYVIDGSNEEIEKGEIESSFSSGTNYIRNICENDENDENNVSRIDILNSMAEDVTKSNATCALLEEYRIMVSPMDKGNLEDNTLKIYCTVNALKESSFWDGERKVSPRTIIN